jgi:transcriptional regulator with XRE-family HTH domain
LRLRIDVKQLAVLAGVNPPAVRHWERGTHRPGPEAARQLTRLLDLTPGEAFRLLAQLAPPTYGSTVYGYGQYAGDH